MSAEELEQEQLEELMDMGPVDYVVLAWPGNTPIGSGVAPMIVDLHERGIIRILDIAFAAKEEDGSVVALDIENLGPDNPFAEFQGAQSGMLDHGDLEHAAEGLEPGSAAAVLVWENRWAAPVAVAIRESGGLLMDGGRIPVQGIIAALDVIEAAQTD